jgi:hypothetical protein
MKKYLLFCLATFLLSLTGFEGQVSAQEEPETRPPAGEAVIVRGSLDDLEIMVRPWRILVGAAGKQTSVEWEVTDPHNLVSDMTVNAANKTEKPGCPSFPGDMHQPNKKVFGPFINDTTASRDGWCSYNIVLEIVKGDGTTQEVTIDPEYRVVPGVGP